MDCHHVVITEHMLDEKLFRGRPYLVLDHSLTERRESSREERIMVRAVHIHASLVGLIDVAFLVSLLSVLSVLIGCHFYNKGEDPDNFMIPIVEAIADFSNMIVLAGLVVLFF